MSAAVRSVCILTKLVMAVVILLIPCSWAVPRNGESVKNNLLKRQSGDDLQTSLTLDESQIQTALQQAGLNASDPTITASLTSINNL